MRYGNLRNYLKGLRYIWWNEGTDRLLSFFFLWFVTVPVLIVVNTAQSFRFTHLYIKKQEGIHFYYQEMIDRSGLYKCHLHDVVFRETCEKKVWA